MTLTRCDVPKLEGWKAFCIGIIVTAMLAGCTNVKPTEEPPVPPSTDEPIGEPPLPPTTLELPPAFPTIDPALEAKKDELEGDASVAVEVVNGFWARHWAEFFPDQGSYRPPDYALGYKGSENPVCGGYHEDMSENAYYCAGENYIAWDWGLILGQGLHEAILDSFVWFVIAHEWGHAIQNRLDLSLVPIDYELQADCLAAAALHGGAADRDEIALALRSLENEVEWGNSSTHGSAEERVDGYLLGEVDGVKGCLEAY